MIFEPYPGTRLYEVCKELNVLSITREGISRRVAKMNFHSFSRKAIQYAFDTFSIRMLIHNRGLNLIIRITDCIMPALWDIKLARILFLKILKRILQ